MPNKKSIQNLTSLFNGEPLSAREQAMIELAAAVMAKSIEPIMRENESLKRIICANFARDIERKPN